MLLEVRNVTLGFAGVRALDDVSMDVGAGELAGIIGPNGAGKTTFFNVISGHYRPQAGQVVLEGKRIDGLAPWQAARAGIARTFQNPRVFPRLTVRENVMAAIDPEGWRAWFRMRSALRDTADEWLGIVELSALADVPAGDLSYGYLRRLEIARACARSPLLLLLDEPAAGMNSAERADLSDLIRRINALPITVVLIEHNMPLVLTLCSRVWVLNFGQLIASGSPDEVRADPAVIDAYLGADVDAAERQAAETVMAEQMEREARA